MIRVQIVERSPIFRIGLVDVFGKPGFEVAGACATADALTWRADVLVVDPAAIDGGVDEFVQTAARVAPVVMTVDDAGPEAVGRFSRAGVAGFIERTAGVPQIHEVTRSAVRGGQQLSTHQAPERPALSPRERQVLRQVARGLTHSQIARLLDISRHTVDTHIKRIRSKLDLGNKADLTRAAVQGNLYGS